MRVLYEDNVEECRRSEGLIRWLFEEMCLNDGIDVIDAQSYYEKLQVSR